LCFSQEVGNISLMKPTFGSVSVVSLRSFTRMRAMARATKCVRLFQWTLSCLSVALLATCGDECKVYSNYSCKQLEKATYNVYFYFPEKNGADQDKEYFLGTAQGLSECGAVAYSYADSKNLKPSSTWSYICCLKTKDSECAEKHRSSSSHLELDSYVF
jgi:hypothetical protein